MNKEDKKIIVIEKDILFSENYFQGFKHHSDYNFESVILKNLKVMRRGDAEQDPTHKQPIGYTTIINPELKKIFVYQRSKKDEKYGEKRLQGKISVGFGGHIEPLDMGNGNPIRESILREIKEEVEIFGDKKLEMYGYINDDSNSVGQVHFGLSYLLYTNATEINPKDKEIDWIKPTTISKLEKLSDIYEDRIETWTKIVLEPLKKIYLGK